MSVRKLLYDQLEPTARKGRGLSPTNRLVSILILFAVAVVILESEPLVRSAAPQFFTIAESWLLTIFSAEYIARVYAAGEDPRYRGLQGRLRYARQIWSIVDLLAIVPFWLTGGTFNSALLRIFKFARLLRVARLGRFSQAWDLLSQSIASRKFELGITAGIAALVLLLSSAVLYVVEGAIQPEAFGSIPRALWWSIATLTTVGYGDVSPVSPIGKIFAGVTAIAGIGLIAMPTGILAAAFSDVIQRRAKAPTEERIEEESRNGVQISASSQDRSRA